MVTKFQIDTILTSKGMDSQMHTIGKAIRPLFADPVTYYDDINALQRQLQTGNSSVISAGQ